jgi:putative ABC transport system permease protein
MSSPLFDLRQAVRQLGREPAFTALGVITLGLGLGATIALFSVASGLFLQPLPYPEADRIVRLVERRDLGPGGALARGITNDTYHAWRESPATVEQLAAYQTRAFTLGLDEPWRVQAGAVSPALFGLLRVRPFAGRFFEEGDAAPGRDRLVVLSHATWRDRFASDPNVVGRVVSLDEEPYTVVGVAPPGFAFPDPATELWTPLVVPRSAGANPNERTIMLMSAIARLAPGVTPAQAEAEGTAAARSSSAADLASAAMLGGAGESTVQVVRLADDLARDVRPAVLVLLAAVALVLLAAAANVANLLVARAVRRQRELGIRAALGADHARLARQLGAESLVLAASGGLAGLLVAHWLIAVLPAVAPAGFPRLADITVDGRVIAFALLVTLVTGVLFGLAPVLHAMRVDLVAALNEGAATAVGGFRRLSGGRLRAGLMVVEVALAMVLLVGASLLARSFVALASVDPGYDAANTLTAHVSFPGTRYDPNAQARFVERVRERLSALPGVVHAGVVNLLPLTPGNAIVVFNVPPRDAGGPDDMVRAGLRIASPGYVEAMGIPVVEGRALSERDGPASQRVLLVNRAYARRYSPDRSVVGTRVPGAFGPGQEWEIVGVIGDVRREGLDAEPEPELWVSYAQVADARGRFGRRASLVVRTTGDPVALAPALHTIVRDVDPLLAIESVMPMAARVSASIAQPRFQAVVLVVFGLATLALAAVGLYGILSYTVSQRRREIGVRTALGATRGDIARLVVGQGLVLASAGILLGLAAAAVASRFLTSLLFGITTTDAVTWVLVPAVLLAVAAAAAFVPARRAALVDPVDALRAE